MNFVMSPSCTTVNKDSFSSPASAAAVNVLPAPGAHQQQLASWPEPVCPRSRGSDKALRHPGMRRQVTHRRCRSAMSRGGRRSSGRTGAGSAGGDTDGGVAPGLPSLHVRAGGDRRGHVACHGQTHGGRARPRRDRSRASRAAPPRRPPPPPVRFRMNVRPRRSWTTSNLPGPSALTMGSPKSRTVSLPNDSSPTVVRPF